MPFAGLWRVPEWPSGSPATLTAGTSANESLEFLAALQDLSPGEPRKKPEVGHAETKVQSLESIGAALVLFGIAGLLLA
jgi:hypothetical protein